MHAQKTLVALLTFTFLAVRAGAVCRTLMTPQSGDVPALKEWAESLQPLLDPTKVQAWNVNARLPCAPPFTATFSAKGKTLTFLAVDHIEGPVAETDPTLTAVTQTIERARPDAILIEMKTGGVQFPKTAISKVLKTPACQQEGRFGCGESAWAALAGAERDIAVFGGEPQLSELVDDHSPRQDLKAFVATRAVLNLNRKGVPAAEWNAQFREELQRDLPSLEPYPLADYQAWRKFHRLSPAEQANAEEIEPRADQKATDLQKFANRIDLAREKRIVESANRLLAERSNLLVVYGSSHFYKQQKVYEARFGPARINCLAR